MYEFWSSLILYVDNVFWFCLVDSKIFLIIMIVLVFVLVFWVIFVKLLSWKLFKNKQKLIYEYDNIFYIISSYNYQTSTSDGIEIFNKLLKKDNLSYISNHKLIFDSVQKIEMEFWKKIITSENWWKIKKFTKKIKFYSLLAKILKFIIILSIILFLVWLYYIKY
jgi:hypothetical protein